MNRNEKILLIICGLLMGFFVGSGVYNVMSEELFDKCPEPGYSYSSIFGFDESCVFSASEYEYEMEKVFKYKDFPKEMPVRN